MSFTHLNHQGQANMVDISDKPSTTRTAKAQAVLKLPSKVSQAIQADDIPKGDLWATARIAGIQAAKQTSQVIPLCHALALSKVTIDFNFKSDEHTVFITTTVKTSGQTGVEMEALHAASIAALTFYDMVKGIDKGVIIERIQLQRKEGGKSGLYQA